MNGISIDVTYLFTGFSDFWSGDCERWDENKGCLFAYYGPDTTYRDLVQGWMDDFNSGGDFDDSPLAEYVTNRDLETALENVFVPGLDFDAIIDAAGELEDYDAEMDESPVCIVLVRLEQDETEEEEDCDCGSEDCEMCG
jgi:hypothetical protein